MSNNMFNSRTAIGTMLRIQRTTGYVIGKFVNADDVGVMLDRDGKNVFVPWSAVLEVTKHG